MASGRAATALARTREEDALRIRASEGLPYAAIGARLGISAQAAQQAYFRALAKRTVSPETVDAYRQGELRQLEHVKHIALEKAVEGDLEAIRAVIMVSQSIRRLLGLDAPTKVDVSIDLRIQIVQTIVARLEAVMVEVGVPLDQRRAVATKLIEEAA